MGKCHHFRTFWKSGVRHKWVSMMRHWLGQNRAQNTVAGINMLCCISFSLQRNINGIKIFPFQYWKCIFIEITSIYQFHLLCKALTVSVLMLSPVSAPQCCSNLASHPKALHLPSSEQVLSQIPHHCALEPSFDPGQRERTRMQQTALGSPGLHKPPGLRQGSCTAEVPQCSCSAALPRLGELGQLALVPPKDSYFCPWAAARVALGQLFTWPGWALRNKAPKFLFAQWAINEMEKWQEGHASAAEQENWSGLIWPKLCTPKTPTGTSLALARPAAVLAVQCISSSPADKHWLVCIMQFYSAQLQHRAV